MDGVTPLNLHTAALSTLALVLVGCPTGHRDDDVPGDDDTSADDDSSGDDDTASDDDTTEVDVCGDDDDWDARVLHCNGEPLWVPYPSFGDLNGDGNADLVIGEAEASGGVFVLDGPLVGDHEIVEARAWIQPSSSMEFGAAVAADGDLNGDGFDDVLAGAPGDGPGGIYLFHGPVDGALTEVEAVALLVGEESQDGAGEAVSYAGDLDHDGLDDVLIGVEDHGAGGAVYVVHPPVAGTSFLADAHAKLEGEGAGDDAGHAVAGARDVDGDDTDDILVGADRQDAGGINAGAAYLVTGAIAGTVNLSDADAKLIGEAEGDRAGTAVAGPGDLDGDGYGDILIGAPDEATVGVDGGAVYLLHGPVAGQLSLASADVKIVSEGPYDGAGASLAAAGDVNGDGLADVWVGARGSFRTYLVLGPASAVTDLSQADRILGEGVPGGLGYWLAGGGDLDGDGYDDLAAASGAAIGGDHYYWQGAVYVYRGGP